ncbi:MAG: hypothetical protein ACKV19_22010 [Verrucomicrobiales bacterium]
MIPPTVLRFALIATALGSSHPGWAGDPVADPTPLAQPAPDAAAEWQPRIGAIFPGYTHQFETDLDGEDIAFSVDRIRFDTGTRIPFSDAFNLTIGFETEWSRYDVESPDFSGWAVATEDLFIGRFGGLGNYKLNDTWELTLGGSISWGGDFDASFSDGLGGNGLFSATYRFSPRFSLSPGVLVLARMEDDALVVPALGLDWQINDAWQLRSVGPGAELTWTADGEWMVFLRGLYRPRDIRLAPDAPVRSGVLRERAFPLTTGVEWTPSPRVTATIFGGVLIGGSLELTESDGKEVFDEDYDVTPLIGGSLKVLF